jgi:hypothetical protein
MKCCVGVLKMNMYELKVIDMSNKEEQAREYAKSRYGNNGHETGNEIAKVQACTVGYIAGWDACLKHLATLPWNEAVNEIAKHIETNRSEKPNSSKLDEV